MAQVVLEHLSKVFRNARGESVAALEDVSLAVKDGERVVIVGPSGSGKTTLLRLIAGLETPAGGTIFFDDRRVDPLPPEARGVGMTFQAPALYPHLTAAENITLGLRLRRSPRGEIAARLAETASMLGIGSCLQRLPEQLSGGERQRVALGRALICRPQILLLDEPLAHLDPPTRTRLRVELAELHRRLGLTMIMVTHEEAEAMTMGERIVVMQAGRLEAVGTPESLYHSPPNLFVARTLGSPGMNQLSGVIRADERQGVFEWSTSSSGTGCGTGPVAFRVPHRLTDARFLGRPLILGLRPEHVRWVDEPPAARSEGLLRASVRAREAHGHETILHLQVLGTTLVCRSAGSVRLQPGEECWVALDFEHAHAFDPAAGHRLDLDR